MKRDIQPLKDLISTSFDFLSTNCGYIKHEELRTTNLMFLRSNCVVIYVNLQAQKQIEAALEFDGRRFTVIIRRLINEQPVSYLDRLNSFLATELLLLSDRYDNYYDELNKYSHNFVGIEKTISNFGALLKRFEDDFCEQKWFDSEKIKKHHIDFYKKKQGFDLTSVYESKESINDIIKLMLSFLLERGFRLELDTDELAPYEYDGWHLIYKDDANIIEIDGPNYDDWRYFVAVNGMKRNIEFQNALKENVPDKIAQLVKDLL